MEFDAKRLAKLFAGSRAPLKSALLDQKRIAGLGNIYVCKSLFRAGFLPCVRPACSPTRLPTRAARALTKAIRAVLEEAIEAGGSTLRDHRQADGDLGYFQHRFSVYDREGFRCSSRRGCGGTVARLPQSGRSTFYCPRVPESRSLPRPTRRRPGSCRFRARNQCFQPLAAPFARRRRTLRARDRIAEARRLAARRLSADRPRGRPPARSERVQPPRLQTRAGARCCQAEFHLFKRLRRHLRASGGRHTPALPGKAAS